MLRWAKSRLLFRCVHVRAGLILHRRPWLAACVNSFVSPFASKAGTHHDQAHSGIRVEVSASKASRIYGNAGVSESKVRRRSSYDSSSDAKISVRIASRQDTDLNLCTSDVKALGFSHHDAKSHLVDGDAQVSGLAAALCSDGDARGAETIASSCETQSPHVLWRTLFKQTQKEAQKVLQAQKVLADLQQKTQKGAQKVLQAQNVLADLQQKMKLLEFEQFSPSDAKRLLKSRAFTVGSVEQITTALQELKKCFPSAELVHEIVVRSCNVLLQPAELVQKKVKLLRDFQVKEKVVSKLCGKGGVLLVSMESLQERLVFFDDFGLTVAARNTMFWKAPLILRCSIEASIQPPLKLLESKGFTKESILKIMQRSPHIFYMSLDSLMKKYEYIRQLGISMDRFPTSLFAHGLSVKSLEEHLCGMRVLGFTEDEVTSMLKIQPAVLGLSPETVKCKVDFLIHKQHRKLAEIAHFPQCLMYSLQARMLPRFHVINELALPKVHSLSYILCPSDSTLANVLGKAIGVEYGSKLVASKLKEAKGKPHCFQQVL